MLGSFWFYERIGQFRSTYIIRITDISAKMLIVYYTHLKGAMACLIGVILDDKRTAHLCKIMSRSWTYPKKVDFVLQTIFTVYQIFPLFVLFILIRDHIKQLILINQTNRWVITMFNEFTLHISHVELSCYGKYCSICCSDNQVKFNIIFMSSHRQIWKKKLY